MRRNLLLFLLFVGHQGWAQVTYYLPSPNHVTNAYWPYFKAIPPYTAVWENAFDDEFSGTSVDLNKWHLDHYSGTGGDKIGMKDNVSVSGGNMKIVMENKTVRCPTTLPPDIYGWQYCEPNEVFHYTYGTAISKQDFKYGYYEARMKTTTWQDPQLASFWLHAATGHECEIDIIETSGGAPNNEVGFNLHYYRADDCINPYSTPPNHDCAFPVTPVGMASPFTLENEWHTHGLEWTPNKLVVYLDGAPIFKTTGHEIGTTVGLTQNIILSNWFIFGGNYAANYPLEVLFDWVRYYEYGYEMCNEDLFIDCDYDFGKHDNQVRRNIIITSDAGCVNSLDVGDNVHMRVSNAFEVNGEFYVPVGAELYVDTDPCE